MAKLNSEVLFISHQNSHSSRYTNSGTSLDMSSHSLFSKLGRRFSKDQRSRRHSQESATRFNEPSYSSSVSQPQTQDNDAPPAYSVTSDTKGQPGPPRNPQPIASSSSSSQAPISPASALSPLAATREQLSLLSRFDTVFLIDDSTSMYGKSWDEVKAVLKAIAPICTRYDSDGIDVHFLNELSEDAGDVTEGTAAGGFLNNTSAAKIEEIFEALPYPCGSTPTGQRLHDILTPYLEHFKAQLRAGKSPNNTGIKPLNLIVITDGIPTDRHPMLPKDVLLGVAKELDRIKAPMSQVGVQFFQVGNMRGAAQALAQLDDGLAHLVRGGVRDIVDTVTWDTPDNVFGATRELTVEGMLKTVLGAMVRRLDSQTLGGR
jgi:uncharacterized protein YegL